MHQQNSRKIFEKMRSTQRSSSLEVPEVIDAKTAIASCNIGAKNRRRVIEHMSKRINKMKGSVIKQKNLHPLLRNVVTDMTNFATKSLTTPMSHFLEQNIRRKIKSSALEQRHSKLLDDIMSEVRQEFIVTTHQASINLKTKSHDKLISRIEIKPCKFVGRTENYPKYLATRKKLISIYVLHFPLHRNILRDCIIKLPHILVNLKSDSAHLRSIEDFEIELEGHLNNASRNLKDFYRTILNLLDEDTETVSSVDPSSYYGACTGLVSVHMSRVLAHTMLHVVNFTNNVSCIPYLILYTTFERSGVLKVTCDEVIALYTNFLTKLVEIGSQFFVLEKVKMKGYSGKRIRLCITEEFIGSCIEKTNINIKKCFEPIIYYLETLNNEFQDIYEDVILGKNKQFSDIIFEEGYEKIIHYKTFLLKVFYVPTREYFSIGQVLLNEFVEIIIDGLKNLIDNIFGKLASQHEHEADDINESFRLIYYRARKDPKTTEELIEITKYMTWVREEFFEELTDRVYDVLVVSCKLITLGPLSEEHMNLNSTIINWLDRIPPVLEQNFVNFDQLKFEAEENLQKVIEDVNDAVKVVYPLLDILNDMSDVVSVKKYLQFLNLHMIKMKEIEKQIKWINQEEVCLSFPKSTYNDYEELKHYIYPFYHLLKLCLDIQRKLSVWQNGQFELLCYETTKLELDKFEADLTNIQKNYRNELRQTQEENTVIKFKGTVDDPDILNWPAPLKLSGKTLLLIKDFRPSLHLMQIMCNPSLKRRHWNEMSEIAGFNMEPNAGTTLRKLMKVDYGTCLGTYEIISIGASKEADLLRRLEKMTNNWSNINFSLSLDEITGNQILTMIEDIQEIIDDNFIKVLNMRSSVFVKPYENEVSEFHQKLQIIDETTDECLIVQETWLRLLPIFSEKHIAMKIPDVTNLFHEVDSMYQSYISKIIKDQNVMNISEDGVFLEVLLECKEKLEIVHKGVCEYIEEIRLFFPRFFFLSVNELIIILSKIDNFMALKTYLNKLFTSVSDMVLENEKILGVGNEQGEKLIFGTPINIDESKEGIERLLKTLEEKIFTTVENCIEKCFNDYNVDNMLTWIQSWPSQLLLVISQIIWTATIHDSIKGVKLNKLNDHVTHKFGILLQIMHNENLTVLMRTKLKILIIDIIHQRNVISELKTKNIIDEYEFSWLAQLKYYLIDRKCVVKSLYTSIIYGNEYINNFGKLIITPLTDRCHRTLLSAYHINLYGSPIGPAGTGKTETVKDLAKLLGKLCIVFSCSDNLNHTIIIRFVKGITASGTWLAFDEFNRIPINITSVLSQVVLTLQLAVKSKSQVANIDGCQLILNPTCFICITMNSGYAGRSSLPENLKVLFRNVAMMVPDSLIITEVSLLSYGFNNAKELSSKIVSAFKFMSERLSIQKHYDFGIRTLKAVLSECDRRKQNYGQENEDLTILKTIRDINCPRLIKEDVFIFESILQDLFPNVPVLPSSDQSFSEASEHFPTLSDMNLMHKIEETYKILHIRQGVIFVGEPASGKSLTIKSLARILNYKFEQNKSEAKVLYKIINPKSVTLDQLYGTYDTMKKRWYDGIVSKYFREYAQNVDGGPKWIIFDGPIDTAWVENVNSVLDDNKKLCLSSGEMISINRSMCLFFEVVCLDEASPATISRCGIIYMERNQDSWKAIINSWRNNCDREWFHSNKEYVMNLISWAIPALLDIMKTIPDQHNIVDINSTKKTLQLFQAVLDDALQSSTKKEEDSKNIRSWIQASFIQACVYGFGSVLNLEGMQKFDELLRILWKGQNEKHLYPESIEKMEVGIPSDGLIVDFSYIYKMKGNWKNLADIIKTEKIMESLFSQQVLVPTIDSFRYSLILDIHIKNHIPLIFIGPSGCGKTITTQNFLVNKLDNISYITNFLSLTNNTTSNKIQKLLMLKLNKKKHGHYGPPENKTSVIFIDDLNMSKRDIYNTQSVLELLRQHLDHNIWYDLTSMSPVYLDDIIFIAAMTLTSRVQICPRFMRHFAVFSMNAYNQDIILRIYSNYLTDIWRKGGFPSDISIVIKQITHATLNILEDISERLKPSVEHILYTFSLFDFGRIIKGCSILKKETSDANKRIFPKIWAHEVFRVLGDRITHKEHKSWLTDKIQTLISDQFQENFEELFENLKISDDEGISLDTFFFGNYEKITENGSKYEEISLLALREICLASITDFNNSHHMKIDVVLFDTAIVNMAKIAHLLSMSGRSAIIIGLSGTGRKTSALLAALLLKQSLYQPIASDNIPQVEWNESVKEVLIASGAESKKSVFLVDDFRIDSTYLFNDLDYILNFNDLQSLFDQAEQRRILEMTRIQAQGGNRNLDISAPSVFLYFNNCCKKNLHVLLCLSSVNANLKRMPEAYPSIMKHCDKISLPNWPDHAFEIIATAWLKEVDLKLEIKSKISQGIKYIHGYSHDLFTKFYELARIKNYVTNIPFLECIRTYVRITIEKQSELIALRNRYHVGLDKLSFAALQIAKMEQSLAEYQPQLEAMTEKAKAMTEEIATETIEVEKVSALVKIDEKIANEQAIAANFLKIDCEADLAQAIPILEDAISALNTLKPSDITLVKSMKNPPDAIKLVMAAVCVIKDVRPDRIPDPSTGRKTIDYWGPSKRILGDMNFLQTLKDFDKDRIKPEVMVKIRKEYLPHKDFLPHVVAKASSAAEGLCKWIIAMDMYDKVAKEVAPKKEKLEKAEKEYAETVAILNQKKEEVARIEAKLATLNSLLDEARKKQQILQREVDLCNKRLRRAQKLIGGLSGEKERWTDISRKLQDHFDNLAGDILISSAIVAYLASFSSEYRKESIDNWHSYMKAEDIPCSCVFNFTQVLGSEGTVQNWQVNFLPIDNFFTENAIIHSYSNRYSLFLDPQFLGKTWIRSTEKRNKLHILKISNPHYINIIKNCIHLGYPVLLEGITEKLHPALEPILSRQIFTKDDSCLSNFNSPLKAYHKGFRLYLVSYLKNPQFDPDVFTRVCLINFSLTTNALKNILSDAIILIEEPHLEKQRASLELENIRNREDLKKLEETILQTLSESKSDILEDEKALKILDDSKNVSNEIRMRQETIKKKEQQIDNFKSNYADVAEYGIVIFDTISQLYKINIMYQYSLDWFLNMYMHSLQTAEKSKTLYKRSENLKAKIIRDLFDRTAISLYVKDRLSFAFFLCVKMKIHQEKISVKELYFFAKFAKTHSITAISPKVKWIPAQTWSNIVRLCELGDHFKNFLDSLDKNFEFYQNFIRRIQLEDTNLPFEWFTKLNNFQKFLVLCCLRPDKISSLAIIYIKQEMGLEYIQPVRFDISTLYNASHSLCPLIFLLTSSTDPMEVIRKFSKQKNVLHKLHTISLGQNQGNQVEHLVKRAQKEGNWVCLQNCHLGCTYTDELEGMFDAMDYENTDENFRLWLITDHSDNFPISIIQNSIKIVDEPLFGLKNNLQRIYLQEPISNEDFYENCPGRVETFTRLLYSISVFHVVIEERKKFGAVGWNIPYEFKSIDFSIATRHLQIFLNEYENPLEALLYMIGECDYGGRVSDDWDQRLCNTLLQNYLNINILVDKYHYLLNDGHKYGFPAKNFHENYLRHISKLPENDPMEIFGLHENLTFIRGMQESRILIHNSQALVNDLEMTGDCRKEVIKRTSLDILNQLSETRIPVGKYIQENFFKVLVMREINQYNILYSNIKSCLIDILDSLECDAILSDEFEDTVESLFNNEIPNLWFKYSYATIYNLSEYVLDFERRIEQLHRCAEASILGQTVWFPMFFFPNAFLATAKQYFSKQNVIPLHNISLEYGIVNNNIYPKGSLNICGLHMEGARWDPDNNCINELLPNMINYIMPTIMITPAVSRYSVKNESYKIPVYRTSERRGVISTSGHSSNYIFAMYLKTIKNPSHWIKRGAALVCQVNNY